MGNSNNMTETEEQVEITQEVEEEINEVPLKDEEEKEEKVEPKEGEEDSSSEDEDHVKCRFYRKKIPDVGDIVIGRIL